MTLSNDQTSGKLTIRHVDLMVLVSGTNPDLVLLGRRCKEFRGSFRHLSEILLYL